MISRGWVTSVVASMVGFGLLLGTAGTSEAASKDFEAFSPTPVPEGGIQVQAPRVPGRFISAGTYLQMQGNPVQIYDSKGELRGTPVPYRLQLRAVGGISFLKRFMVGIDLPAAIAQSVATEPGKDPVFSPAMNDMILKGRVTILDKRNWALGAGVDLRLNTGNADALGGLDDRFAEAAFWVMGEYDIKQIFLRINAGYQERSLTKIPEFGVIRDDQISYRLGGGYRVREDVNNVFLEFAGSTDIANFDSRYGYQNELYAGYQHQLGAFVVGPGAALGLGKGYGTPLYRVLAMAWYTLPINDTAVDADDDNAINTVDDCPMEQEDRDGYRDDDGCPESDNDNDTVTDATDLCPGEPEDSDGFEDADGCPDTDNDRDQIADVTDVCPNEAEDIDGFEDGDGCPDLDNDGDGLVDALDKCIGVPESRNGYQDEDGCPDDSTSRISGQISDAASGAPISATVTLAPEDVSVYTADGQFHFDTKVIGAAQLRVQSVGYLEATFALNISAASDVTYAFSLEKPKGRIQVTQTSLTVDPIFFVAGKATIEKRSADALDVLAQYLRLNPGVGLSIEGHTDDKGDAKSNAKLSSRRAAAVVDALVDRGIEISRLSSIGYGEDRPLVPNDSEENRAQNRRVEFILKR